MVSFLERDFDISDSGELTLVCMGCGERKVLDAFKPDPMGSYGRADDCLDCMRQARRPDNRTGLEIYGLDEAAFNEMLWSQGGVCKICMQPNGDKRLVVDHDHATGAVRGLLCSLCNSGLGFFKDSLFNLEGAIRYLLTHQAKESAC